MVRKLIRTKGGLSLVDMFGVGVVKVLSERFLTPIVGNANIMSGALKIGGAFILPQVASGKVGTIIGTALAVDGVEDVVSSFLNGSLSGGLFGGNDSGEVI